MELEVAVLEWSGGGVAVAAFGVMVSVLAGVGDGEVVSRLALRLALRLASTFCLAAMERCWWWETPRAAMWRKLG